MPSIDLHAHMVPPHVAELTNGGDWHGLKAEKDGEGNVFLVKGSKHFGIDPKSMWTPEQRLADMDSLGVDVHVLSTWVQLYNYDWPVEACLAVSKDFNDYVAELCKQWPQRFKGFATLPMQDVNAAIAELDRSMNQLGLVGAEIGDHVNGRAYDEPEFVPFWQAVEDMGAVILFHQASPTIVGVRSTRYHLPNIIGNPGERTVSIAALIFGGVMERHPNLKICLCHGGGYACFGAGRLDRGWQVRSEARVNISQPPSTYLNRFYYDCLTHSEPALRLIIDTVGIDQVVLGSDWPYDMGLDSPVDWVNSMNSLTAVEKTAIISENPARLLGMTI